MAANVITGAKAKIRIPGKGIVGYATGISIAENTLNGRVESLGYIDSREIVPISRNVTVQCSMIRIFNIYNKDVNQYIYSDPTSGDTQTVDERQMINTQQTNISTSTQAGISEVTLTQRTLDVLNTPYFDLEVFDSSNSESPVIYTVKHCKIASQNIVVDRASLMGVQVVLDAEYLLRHAGASTI